MMRAHHIVRRAEVGPPIDGPVFWCRCGFTSFSAADWHWRDPATLTGAEIAAATHGYLPSFPLTRQQRREFFAATFPATLPFAYPAPPSPPAVKKPRPRPQRNLRGKTLRNWPK